LADATISITLVYLENMKNANRVVLFHKSGERYTPNDDVNRVISGQSGGVVMAIVPPLMGLVRRRKATLLQRS
jgi:hypothetical protein